MDLTIVFLFSIMKKNFLSFYCFIQFHCFYHMYRYVSVCLYMYGCVTILLLLITFFFNLGGRYKSWKRRWFILNDNCLYYFEYTTVSLLIFLHDKQFVSPHLFLNSIEENKVVVYESFMIVNICPCFTNTIYFFCNNRHTLIYKYNLPLL